MKKLLEKIRESPEAQKALLEQRDRLIAKGWGEPLIKRSTIQAAANMIIRADAEQDMAKKKPRRNKRFGAAQVIWDSYGDVGGMVDININWLYSVKDAEQLVSDLQQAIEYIKERS